MTAPDGSQAAAFDPGTKRESVVTHTAAQDGDYLLTVRDRYRRGGDRFVYRLTTWLEQPDFELSAAADAIVVKPDKPTEFEVKIQRRSSVGAITIEAVSLPEGVTAPAVVAEAKGDTAKKVTLKFSTVGPAYSGPIQIIGTAAEPGELRRHARTPSTFGACFETIWLTAVAKEEQ